MTPKRRHAFQHAGAGLLTPHPSPPHMLRSQYTMAYTFPTEKHVARLDPVPGVPMSPCLKPGNDDLPASLNQRNSKHSGRAPVFLLQ